MHSGQVLQLVWVQSAVWVPAHRFTDVPQDLTPLSQSSRQLLLYQAIQLNSGLTTPSAE